MQDRFLVAGIEKRHPNDEDSEGEKSFTTAWPAWDMSENIPEVSSNIICLGEERRRIRHPALSQQQLRKVATP